MRHLVFGLIGQVARAQARLSPEAVFLPRAPADRSDPAACAAAIWAHHRSAPPDTGNNAAVSATFDAAKTQELAATVINADATAAMAHECAALGIPFLTISTDYVFGGSGDAPWAPKAAASPLNAYCRPKLAGELGVRSTGAAAAILRSFWVFSPGGKNLLKTMLRLSRTEGAHSIVAVQIGGPTRAEAAAHAAIRLSQAMLTGHRGGHRHIAGAPYVSWADFAAWIFACAWRQVAITPIGAKDYSPPARRPLNSRLECTTLARDFVLAAPDCKAAVRADFKRLML